MIINISANLTNKLSTPLSTKIKILKYAFYQTIIKRIEDANDLFIEAIAILAQR